MAGNPIAFYNNKDPEHDTYATDPCLELYDLYSPAPTAEYCVLNCVGWTIPTGKVFKEWNSMRDGSGYSLNPGEPISDTSDKYAIWEDEPAPVEYITTDTELTSIADAIRTKGGTSSPLSYPEGFISAINDISGGDAFADAIIMRSISEYSNSTCSTIGSYAFAFCSSLTMANFPSCTKISDHAFYYCRSLATISFPVCTSIESYAFEYCSSLTTANFPSCISIGLYAFDNCSRLETISFPVCTSIGSYAFAFCSSLTTANFPSCISIGSYAFESCQHLTTISFPVCTSIGSNAFYYCASLTTISFPVCTNIGSSTFYRCSNITTAIFPECMSIGSGAFYGCNNISTISFPKCTSIGSNAFYRCSNITMASFGECSIIFSSAFKECIKLTSVYFMSTSVVKISAGTASTARPFYSTPMEDSTYTGAFGSIYVPASLVDAYKSASGWSFYSSRIAAYSLHITIKFWDNFEDIGNDDLYSSIEECELDPLPLWDDIIQEQGSATDYGFLFVTYGTDRWDGTHQPYIGISISFGDEYAFPLFYDDGAPVLPNDLIVSDGVYWSCLDMLFEL